ncbi:MAG: prepilin-type N-terminal cleavage/methylation domain-containing protein [Desulfobacterales bacterium]|nr:MAG: prepilin-type N-terminal cleavage/methylation domain-containing protein [Desulfobacterales bacterium]
MSTLTIKYRISLRRSLWIDKWSAAAKCRRPGTSSRRQARGFTLLEVITAVAIMSIVLVSVYKMHSQSITMNSEARFYTQAPMLAQGKLAELETSSEDEIAGDSGDFGENFPGYTWSVIVDDVDIEALGEISEDLQRIDVTVSYNNDEHVYRFRTYRLNRQ